MYDLNLAIVIAKSGWVCEKTFLVEFVIANFFGVTALKTLTVLIETSLCGTPVNFAN